MNEKALNCAAAGMRVAETSLPNRNLANQAEQNGQECHQPMAEWKVTVSDFSKDRCVHELFAEQAARTPTADAVVLGDEHLSYSDLDARANQVAHYLRGLGVGPEVLVGLCIERSFEMIVQMLGILKAGGTFLPLDKNHPGEHLAFLLNDAGARLVLTSLETETIFAPLGVQTVRLDGNSDLIATQPKSAPLSSVVSENLAYVMYTSGSSGKPKGVGIVHYNINRLVKSTNYVQIASTDVFLQLAPITFDASTFEIWGALLNGAKLVLYPPDPMPDLLKLKNLLQKAGVTILWLTSGLFNRIVETDMLLLAPVKQLLVGGDVVPAEAVRQVLERIKSCRIINGYGPTEGTTFSVCFPVPDSSAIETVVPIGRPISNTTVYVLDFDLQPVSVETPGELYIGGAGLSRGYFQRPHLTAESFIPNPFEANGSRLYRTGDKVRYSRDGILQFVGRVDFQVKVRGYRIELEEVEAALLSYSEISQAAAAALPDTLGDKRLIAYVVGTSSAAVDLKQLREHLRKRLPEYMVPSAFIILNALPLNANGKIDRSALPAPQLNGNSSASLPAIEAIIAEIWASALGVGSVGVQDDFFDLGGTSLGMIHVVMEMSKRFEIPLDTSIVARGSTVSALAQAVKEKFSTFVPSSLECFAAQ